VADILATVFLDAEYAAPSGSPRVRFPVQQAQASGGHDAAEHVAYRRPGADVEWTGLKAYQGSLTIPLLDVTKLNTRYGRMVPDVRQRLISTFESNPIGLLTHPFRGVFLALMSNWRESMDPENRGGTILEVDWVEHTPSSGDFVAESRLPAAAQDAPTAATTADAAADALPGGRPSGYAAMGPAVTLALTTLGTTPAFGATVVAFRDLFAAVTANQALPALLAVSGAAALLAQERLRAALYVARESLLPGLADVRTYVVPRTAPLWQIAVDVYQSAALTSLLFAANAVRDPSAVPAGTVLTILPSS
jgi:prophage DNA circulation protein